MSASSQVFVEAIGVAAPGLPNWSVAASVLRGESAFDPQPLPPHAPAVLPPNERRRATTTVRLAFAAAEDAMAACSVPAQQLATVFASSDADLNVIHRICLALGTGQRLVSPTDFHNSVHNAAAGYWSIAVGARTASNTISAYDDSFAVGLSEAIGLAEVDGADVLLVAFDLPPPEPLYAKRPIAHPASVALVLTRERTSRSLASLRIEPAATPPNVMADIQLEALRTATPAMRALPLLHAFAERRAARIVLSAEGGQSIAVDIAPL